MSNDAESSIGGNGHGSIHKELFVTLYSELRRAAARQLRRSSAATFSPTTLLHETFLSWSPAAEFDDKAHFLAYAARAMRFVMVDHLRSRNACKRGGGYQITALPTEVPGTLGVDLAIDELGDAIEVLAASQPRLAECVDLKFFCGFSFGEIARMWRVSERTVRRDWSKARLLLLQLIVKQQCTSAPQS